MFLCARRIWFPPNSPGPTNYAGKRGNLTRTDGFNGALALEYGTTANPIRYHDVLDGTATSAAMSEWLTAYFGATLKTRFVREFSFHDNVGNFPGR